MDIDIIDNIINTEIIKPTIEIGIEKSEISVEKVENNIEVDVKKSEIQITLEKQGPKGADGEILLDKLVVEEDVKAGQALYIKSNSKCGLADNIDNEKSNFVGLAKEDTDEGFVCDIINNSVLILDDWTIATNSEELSVGSDYYLSTNGKITKIAPNEGYVLRIGKAVKSNSLKIELELKIKL
jgi:hypothetical protein